MLGYPIRFLLYAEIIFNFYSKLILLNGAISYIFHDFIYHLLLFLQRFLGKKLMERQVLLVARNIVRMGLK